MPTTAGKLADDLGVAPEQVLQACRTAGVSTFGAQTPLDDREVARVHAVLRVPPQQWPVPPASPGPFALGGLPPPPGAPIGNDDGGTPPLLTAVVVVLVAFVIGVIAYTLTRPEPADEIPRVTSLSLPPTTATTVPFTPFDDLATGECWNDPAVESLVDSGSAAVTPQEVRCDAPHQAEVYAVVTHPAGPREPDPGDEALQQFAYDQCLIRFEGFVGVPLDSSTLDIMTLSPTPRGWLLGDRLVICSVYPLDGTLLTGTAAGSRR